MSFCIISTILFVLIAANNNSIDTSKKDNLQESEAETWVQQSQQGDTRAFGFVYEYYMPLIFKFIYFRLNSKEDAEDITEKIFFKAWNAIQRYDSNKSSFKTWLFTIAKRTLIDFYRTHKVTYELTQATNISVDDKTEENIDKKIALGKIIPVLKSLPKKQSQVLTLRFISGLSIKETAAIMNKSNGSIRILQYRALKQLKSDIEYES